MGVGADGKLRIAVVCGSDVTAIEHVMQARDDSGRSRGGLGIGLNLVRLVELHGGHVDAASDGPHQGSHFTVHLPLKEDA